jgi:hypothetical protein
MRFAKSQSKLRSGDSVKKLPDFHRQINLGVSLVSWLELLKLLGLGFAALAALLARYKTTVPKP